MAPNPSEMEEAETARLNAMQMVSTSRDLILPVFLGCHGLPKA